MKPSFDACAFVTLAVLAGAVALAEQSPVSIYKCKAHEALKADGSCKELPADVFGEHQRQAQKDLAATRAPSFDAGKPNQISTIRPPQKPITFNMVPNPTALAWARPCKDGHNEYSFIVNDGDGQPIVSINECTGKVTVAHPERMNQQAREFWRTLQHAWPDVCAPRPAK